MKKIRIGKELLLLLYLTGVAMSISAQIQPQFLGRFSTGIYNNTAAEISAFDPATKRMFVLNGADTSFKVVNISNPSSPQLVASISAKPYGIDLTSIACKNGVVAITVLDSLGKTENGKVVFFSASTLSYINQVDVGANPDMLIFTPDGKKILVANEGEPNNGYTIDPEGSVSIIDLSKGISAVKQIDVKTATFTKYNGTAIDSKIKITGKIQSGGTFLRNSTIAEDLEPEFITVSEDGNTAWVTCQENNCIAEIDIVQASVTKLIALGFKNHNITGQGLDASDNGGTINIANYPVFGMYQPDAISSYSFNDTTYLFTANEGDARADWGSANLEETRFGSSSYIVDTAKFGGAANVAALKANTALGRLNVSKFFGDFNKDGKFDSIFCYGARSFSVWNSKTGALVWDSKDQFEKITSSLYPTNFNASSSNNTLKNRSDDKGPEPEAIAVGKILDSVYAFIGLERIGGIMIYNITNPGNPYFVNYINTRNFAVSPGSGTLSTVGELGPEGLVFVPAGSSPNGKDMLLVSNEISGTVAIIQLNSRSAFQLQILHSSDMESSVPAVKDAPYYAAIVDNLEDQHVNTLILSSGDNTLPGPFLSAGEDPSLQTPLRNTAAAYFSGSQALRPAIGRTDIAIMNIIGFNASALGNHEFDLGTADLNGQIGVDIRSSGADKRWLGAQFPYVSCNLDFSKDANLNYLYTSQVLSDTAFKTPKNITNNNQKKGLAPAVIIERNGERIGIVGATTQVLAKISSPGFTSIMGPQVDDMPALAAIIQPVVDSLIAKEGVNKVILLAHLQQIANEKALAPLLNHVDIILSGGNHNITADVNDRLIAGHTATETYPIFTKAKNNDPMVILNTTSEWKYVGRFVCDFDTNGLLLTDVLNNKINGVYACDSLMVSSLWGSEMNAFATGTKGNYVKTLCTAIGNVINSKDGNIIGKSKVFLEGRRNFVRTEETNLGNLSSDANLWYARKYDPQVKISLKNGGGIRSAIGYVNSVGSNVILESPRANPGAGKNAGDISQLDVENSLRFNNRLVIVSTKVSGVKRLLEHGFAATKPGATPGQFPQVGGVALSYDTTKSVGNKIWSLVIIDSLGNRNDTLVRNGQLAGDTNRVYKIVTLNFLANPSATGSPVGGDGYPFPAVITSRVDLDSAIKINGTSNFALKGSEQDAFAEYMLAKHNTTNTAYSIRDTSIIGDKRIQLLNARPDLIFPETTPVKSIAQTRNTMPPTLVRTRGVITRAWGRFIYIQDASGAIAIRQSSGAMVDSIATKKWLSGDSVEVVGLRNDFNNYAQIQLNSGAFTSSSTVLKLASARPLPAIQELTVSQLLANPEIYESELIRIKNLSIQKGTDTAFKASQNYNVWDGNAKADSTILRIIAATDTEIDDAPALKFPAGLFTFEGILIQFCSSPSQGCPSGYQLQGTRKADIIPQLGKFSLLLPSSETRLVVKDGDNTPVQITWEASANATSYRWLADVTTGNFSNPLLGLSSDNNGTNTKLTLTSGSISNTLQVLGVQSGDSITVKWTVRAYRNSSDSLLANSSNVLKLIRYKEPVGAVAKNDVNKFKLYPNPANDYLLVQAANTISMDYSIIDLSGRMLMTGTIKIGEPLSIKSLNNGVYFFRTEKGTNSFIKN